MRIVAGLGNPGDEYAGTRHNVGFAVVDKLAERLRAPFSVRGGVSAVVDRRHGASPFVLVKPLTYMNCSGEPLRMVMRDMGVAPSDVLVVLDDFQLALGTLRVRASGSDGGHNGLRSVAACLGTNQYPRLRIGVGPAPERMPWEVFVLRRFDRGERVEADEAVERAADAAQDWVHGTGVETLMNRYNRKA